jgi:hypothetical protein
MKTIPTLLFFTLIIIVFACRTMPNSRPEAPSAKIIDRVTQQPPITVYKTKGNYNNLVPIRLSDDKTQIVSYPAPSDLKKEGEFLYPTELEGSLLIDNLGISKNTVFIKLTYEEYAALQNTLPLSELFKLIVDKAPFLEMYDCGNKQSFTNLKEQLNDQIRKGEFKKLYKRTF